MCDPNSAPLLPCKAESDANAPAGSYPGAGAAFVELQFYPPGFAPFSDAISCDNSHWCSALNIDSLECQGNGSGPCNNQCTEPVNFAFVQTNGVPTGPPSPQLSNNASFRPNRHTLLMNPGDKITVQMFDAKIPGGHALEVKETDWSTGQSGFMIASGKNGFMNTNPFTCAGHRFNFQPEYNTARAANIIPWGIGPYMINAEYEIGHFEPCTKVTGAGTLSLGKHHTDTYYKHCAGPYEAGKDTAKAGLEPNDAPCYRFGDTAYRPGRAEPGHRLRRVPGRDRRPGLRRHAVPGGLAELGPAGPVPVLVPATTADHGRRQPVSGRAVHDRCQRDASSTRTAT